MAHLLADGNDPVTKMSSGDCDTFPGFSEPSAEPAAPSRALSLEALKSLSLKHCLPRFTY